jgi:twinkle protein
MTDATLETFKSVVLDAALHGARVHCPACSEGRKKSHIRTLSVDVVENRAVYKCHHCDESGAFTLGTDWVAPIPRKERPKPPVDLRSCDPLGESHYQYLLERGISAETADRCGVVASVRSFAGTGPRSCIGFPYKNPDGSDAIKWRDREKHFSQSGSAQSLWGIESFTGGDLVICEGELDRLSFEEVGIAATSVPNGAPSPRKHPELADTPQPAYLWESKASIDNADRVIIATDNDAPGNALADELARRIGKARCWRVPFPSGCKDANDVLVQHGALALVECLDDATPWPVAGLRDAREYRDEAIALFHEGFDKGLKTGLHDLDSIFTVTAPSINIVTGIPGSGKSTFLTWLSVQLAARDWGIAVLSAETSSQIHLLQLASSYIGKPFRGGMKMSEEELRQGLDWVERKFVFLDEADTDIDSIIDRVHAAVLRNGVKAFVLDPWNFVSSTAADDGSVGAINRTLVRLKTLASDHGIAVFVVAHPVKQHQNNDGRMPVVGGYSISGSAAFFGVADVGLTVSRAEGGNALISNWKSRFPWNGRVGHAVLGFDQDSARFSEVRSGWEDDGPSFD